eukprot:TRINITY_DN1933_c0_g1_i2.p1 TRINITY_DN1933_c0_g1~~TRINITY_DN1933_c0_g1_i2.p1  ORF type:complete len:494 (-),score=154.48 TRINITY_DN1933_c0_g1_i2:871-2352(-)
MARPQQYIIETFMSITGASEAIAFQKLEEHGGNLNQAINAHFNEDDRTTIHPVLAPQDDFMAIDDPNQEESQGPSQSLPSATGNLNPIASLDPKSGPSFSDGGGTAEVTGHAPQVSNPGEVGEVPIRLKDGTGQSGHSGLNPSVKDATGSAQAHGPEDNGIVIIDDEEDAILSITPAALSAHPNERANEVDERRPGISVPQLDNAIDNSDDIEEEMLRAAIEASKREVDRGYSDQQFGIPYDTSGSRFVQGSSHSDDFEFARAVSMSLKTAQQEKALREKVGSVGTEQQGVSQSSDVEESGKLAAESERQGFSLPNMQASSQVMVGEGNSSVQEEVEDVEEQPLVRHRSRRISFGASSDAMESAAVVEEMVDSLPSSPIPHDITNHPQPNGDAFHSDEWGGISSEEHDDAVMLEAAIFGGIPEENAYHHRFAYPLHDARHTGLDRNAGLYPRPAPRPPSPTLVEQRLLREQQVYPFVLLPIIMIIIFSNRIDA